MSGQAGEWLGGEGRDDVGSGSGQCSNSKLGAAANQAVRSQQNKTG